MSALMNKRIIIFDRQGLTGKKIEIYSIPYRSIDMWSTENAGKLFDIDAELELWTKAGHFKINVDKKIGQVKVLSYVTDGRPSAGISQRQGCTDNSFPHPADSEHRQVLLQTSGSVRFHVLLKNAGGQ